MGENGIFQDRGGENGGFPFLFLFQLPVHHRAHTSYPSYSLLSYITTFTYSPGHFSPLITTNASRVTVTNLTHNPLEFNHKSAPLPHHPMLILFHSHLYHQIRHYLWVFVMDLYHPSRSPPKSPPMSPSWCAPLPNNKCYEYKQLGG